MHLMIIQRSVRKLNPPKLFPLAGWVYHEPMLGIILSSAVSIVEDHEIIVVNLISHDLGPRLLNHIDVLVFKCKVEARRQEAVDMRRMPLNRRGCTVVAKATQLGVSHGPQYGGLRTFWAKKTVHCALEEGVTLRAMKYDGAVDDTFESECQPCADEMTRFKNRIRMCS